MSYIKLTKKRLGGIFDKPPLKDKYLKKPPFRFIHDCVNATRKKTGFLEGVWQGDWLNGKHEMFKDKDVRVAFLQRLRRVLELSLGESLEISEGDFQQMKPKKLNLLLQKLGQAGKRASKIDMQSVLEALDAPEVREEDLPAEPACEPEVKEEIIEEKHNAEPAAPTEPKQNFSEIKQKVEYSENPLHRSTQELMQNIFAKPPLKSSYLKKAPTKWLLDVCRAVNKQTHFFEGVLSAKQLDSKFHRSLEGQEKKTYELDFLATVIKHVERCGNLDLEISAKDARKCANSDKTNIMLQTMAKLATGKSVDKLNENTDSKENVDANEPNKNQVTESPQPCKQTTTKEEAVKIEPLKTKKKNEKTKSSRISRPKSEVQKRNENRRKSGSKLVTKITPPNDSSNKSKQSTKITIKGPPYVSEESAFDNAPAEGLPPRAPQKPTEMIQTIMARQGPPRPRSAKGRSADGSRCQTPNIIIDGEVEEKEKNFSESEFEDPQRLSATSSNLGDLQPQGKLVRELFSGEQPRNLSAETVKSSESTRGEEYLEQLRERVQKICTSVIPLGKCLDLVFEDLEHMRQEHEKWRTQYDQLTEQLEEEKKQTADHVSMLQSKLKQRLQEQKDLESELRTKKSKIYQTQKEMEFKLMKMIGLIT